MYNTNFITVVRKLVSLHRIISINIKLGLYLIIFHFQDQFIVFRSNHKNNKSKKKEEIHA